MTPRTFLVQRATAALLAPLVITHLVLIIVAVQRGLSAPDILARTSGSPGWMVFYGIFVLAAAIHASIGLAAILYEWTRFSSRAAAIISHLFMISLILLGWRAVYAVVT